MKLFSDILLKARKGAPIGTRKQFGTHWYVKTTEGWKYDPRGENSSISVEEHRTRKAATKKERYDKVIKMAQEGRPTSQISEATGLSAARIMQHIVNARKQGIDIAKRKRIGKEKLDVYKAYSFAGESEFRPPERSDVREDAGERQDISKGYYQYGENKIQVARSKFTKQAEHNYVPENFGGSLKPRQHQTDLINAVMEGFSKDAASYLCADGTGCGKTIEELGLAASYRAAYGGKVLLVTENDRIMAGGMASDSIKVNVKMNPVKKLEDFDKGDGIYVTTYKDLEKLKEKYGDVGLVIFDEAHNMKNAVMSSKAKNGMELMRAAKHNALFTATPIDKPAHLEYICAANKLNFKAVMKALGYYRSPEGWGTNLEAEEIADRLDGFFSALTQEGGMAKREVPMNGLDLHMKTVKLSSDQQSKYDAAYEKMQKQLEVSEPREKGLLKAKWLLRIRSLLEEFKTEHVVESIELEMKEGRQVVLFATSINDRVATGEMTDFSISEDQFDEIKEIIDASGGSIAEKEYASLAGFYGVPLQTIEAINKGNDYEAVVDLTADLDPEDVKSKFAAGSLKAIAKQLKAKKIEFGSVFNSNKDAVKQIDAFQAGKLKCIIGSPGSMGTGVSLDDTVGDAPRTCMVITPPFSAVDHIQMLGRVHRLSTKSRSRAVMLSTNTDVERWNKSIIANKLAKLGAAVKGDYESMSIEDLEKAENMKPDEAKKFLESRKKSGIVSTGPSRFIPLSQFKMSDEQIDAQEKEKVVRKARRKAKKGIEGTLKKGRTFLPSELYIYLGRTR